MDLIGLVGATIIFTWSTLFEKVRNLYQPFQGFFKCSLCIGFWVGILGGVLRKKSFPDIFFTGTTVSLLSFATYLSLLRLQGITLKREDRFTIHVDGDVIIRKKEG